MQAARVVFASRDVPEAISSSTDVRQIIYLNA